MPSRAIRFDANPAIWVPRNTTEPRRCGTIPMIARRVVVFPAPLRPSKVTTSPSPTAKLIPCSMCDSPYQACSSSTRNSSGTGGTGSGMTGSEIGFDDLGVLRHRRVIAFGQDPAAGQHCDRVGEIGDDREIVLDHQNRAFGRDLADQCRNAANLLLAKPGHRFVEQQHFG